MTARNLTVESAAILLDGKVYSVPRPGRHHDVIRLMRDQGVTEPQTGAWEQGFVLSDGRFARRKPAGLIAKKAGQIVALKWPPSLYSEDLW